MIDRKIRPEIKKQLLGCNSNRTHWPLFISVLLLLSNIVLLSSVCAQPDAFIEGNQADPGAGFLPTRFGSKVAPAGDINGDGFADIIVAAPGWNGGEWQEGAVFVFLGSATGIVGTDPATAHARIESNQIGARFGDAIAAAGDINADGFDDIIIGAPRYRSTITDPVSGPLTVAGAAFVFLGSMNGIVATNPADAHAWIQADALTSDLGHSVASAGDVNDDGFADIIIGAPKYGIRLSSDTPSNTLSGEAGAALLFLGSSTGIDGTGFADADTLLTPYPSNTPTLSNAAMGHSVATAGDVNNDGFDDILVSAPGYNGGAVFVFLGGTTGIIASDPRQAHATIQSSLNTPLGEVVATAGDINNDGFADIILGSPSATTGDAVITQEGAALLFLGSATGITATDSTDAHRILRGNIPVEALGLSVAAAGDVDNDGFADIVLGARSYAGSRKDSGVAYVFRGSADGLIGTALADAYMRFSSEQSGAAHTDSITAMSVAGAGDVNNDGFNDVLLGVGYYDNGEENEGAVFAYHGDIAPVISNLAPIPVPGPNQVIIDTDNNLSEAITLDGSASTDPDGTIATYQWYQGEVLLGTSAILTTTLSVGQHVLVLVVSDNLGNSQGAPLQVQVDAIQNTQVAADNFDSGNFSNGIGDWAGPWSISGENVLLDNTLALSLPFQTRIGAAPTGLSRAVTLPTGSTGLVLQYWGRASDFAASDQVQVQLSRDGGDFTTIETITNTASDGLYQFHNINVPWFPLIAASATIRFESALTAGAFFIDDVVIRALIAPTEPVNQAPLASAGPDQTLIDNNGDGVESVTLDGSGSTDSDGTIVSYVWREGTTILGLDATFDLSLAVGEHTLTLTVTDDAGATSTDNVVITVQEFTPTGSLAFDGFESNTFAGGTGAWTGAWSTAGNVRMRTQNSPYSGSHHVRLIGAAAQMSRSVNVTNASNVQVTFWGRAAQFADIDQLQVRLSIDGAAANTALTITSTASDNLYQFYLIDLSSATLTSSISIEFVSEMTQGRFFLDDVKIIGTSSSTTP